MNTVPTPQAQDVPAFARPSYLPPYETVALVLQGGGALGAYQAGVYEGLLEAGIEPDCLSGISIGALNTAIIAGNPPERQVERLREFWNTICEPYYGWSSPACLERALFGINDVMREAISAFNASNALVLGQRGFFRPAFPLPCKPHQAFPREPAITTPAH